MAKKPGVTPRFSARGRQLADKPNDLTSYRAPPGVWRTIDTAPKDGTVIAIRGDVGPYGLTSWEGTARWDSPVNWHKSGSTWIVGEAVLRLAGFIPTHWRPL